MDSNVRSQCRIIHRSGPSNVPSPNGRSFVGLSSFAPFFSLAVVENKSLCSNFHVVLLEGLNVIRLTCILRRGLPTEVLAHHFQNETIVFVCGLCSDD